MRGIYTACIGGCFVYGGMSGEGVLVGTESSVALTAVGLLVIAAGLWQLGMGLTKKA